MAHIIWLIQSTQLEYGGNLPNAASLWKINGKYFLKINGKGWEPGSLSWCSGEFSKIVFHSGDSESPAITLLI